MIALAALALAVAQPSSAPVQLAQVQTPVEQWQLDQLRIASDTSEKVLKALEPVHSLDEAILVLKRFSVPYQRTEALLLPDRLPENIRTTILGLPKGEPFVLPEGSFISISVIVGRKLPPDAVRFLAPRAPYPSLTEA